MENIDIGTDHFGQQHGNYSLHLNPIDNSGFATSIYANTTQAFSVITSAGSYMHLNVRVNITE